MLKAYGREIHSDAEFTKQADDYKRVSMELVKVNALFFPALLILVGLSTIITLYVGGLKVMQGAITIGNVAEFIIYVNMLPGLLHHWDGWYH